MDVVRALAGREVGLANGGAVRRVGADSLDRVSAEARRPAASGVNASGPAVRAGPFS